MSTQPSNVVPFAHPQGTTPQSPTSAGQGAPQGYPSQGYPQQAYAPQAYGYGSPGVVPMSPSSPTTGAAATAAAVPTQQMVIPQAVAQPQLPVQAAPAQPSAAMALGDAVVQKLSPEQQAQMQVAAGVAQAIGQGLQKVPWWLWLGMGAAAAGGAVYYWQSSKK